MQRGGSNMERGSYSWVKVNGTIPHVGSVIPVTDPQYPHKECLVCRQVVDWFVSHTPNAMKDIAVLERADKECVQPLGRVCKSTKHA